MKKTPETTAPENPAAPAETPVKSPSENSTGNSTEKPLENSTGNWASVPSSTEGKTFTLVIYRSSLESEIMEQLEELGLNHFTKWTEVLGQGAHSEPHLDSHIWPGSNNVLGIVTDKTTEDILYDMVARIRKKAPGEGIKALTLPLLRHS